MSEQLDYPEKPKNDQINIPSQPLQPPQAPPVPPPAAPSVVIINEDSSTGCLVQLIWFIFVGWWLSQLAIIASYILIFSIILLPFGLLILNKIPSIIALRHEKKRTNVEIVGNSVVIRKTDAQQFPMWIRAIYFVLIGWWFTALIIEVAWLLGLTFFLLPFSILIFDFVPMALTLRKRS